MAIVTDTRPDEHWRPLEGLEIAVPASIGNVGPGFDALSIALRLYLRLRVVGVRLDGRGTLTCEFVDCHPSGENRVARGYDAMRARHGDPLPSLTIEVRSDIPPRAGLGSSAAAAVGGLRLFEAATERRPVESLLAAAAEIEGHPDNAASALCGGLSACCQREDGTYAVWSWPWPEAVAFVVATPAIELETALARRVLPPDIPRADAVFNLQHTLLLVHALQSGDRALLREALHDRWHQPFRRMLVPGLDRVLALDHPALLGACLSGSGPSVVALAEHDVPAVEALLADEYRRLGIACTIRRLTVHQKGSP
jgi:homoserine kinase